MRYFPGRAVPHAGPGCPALNAVLDCIGTNWHFG